MSLTQFVFKPSFYYLGAFAYLNFTFPSRKKTIIKPAVSSGEYQDHHLLVIN